MKMGKKILSTFLALAVAVTCLIVPGTDAKAATYENKYDANGLFFGTSVYNYGNISINAQGQLVSDDENEHTEYVDKLRLVKEKGSDDYPIGYLGLDSKTSDAEIIAVKSSSKNLKCIISDSYKSTYTFQSKYDNETDTWGWADSTVGVLAKKTGTYKVTATVKLANGTTVDKVATVKVVNKYPIEIKPATSKLTTDGTYDAKSVKVKIVKGKDVSNVQSYYSNKIYTKITNADGTTDYAYNNYKKFKSGKKITLNKQVSPSYTDENEYRTHKHTTNYWYAPTSILVIYTDNFYGVNTYTTTTLEKYRKIK